MITLERTQDMDVIRRIATDPWVWNGIADDYAPAPSEYQPPPDGAVYVLVKQDGAVCGFWALVPKSHIRGEVHTCLLRTLRGFGALDAAGRMKEWIWQNTPWQSIFTEVPDCNPAALWFAKAAGMTKIGTEPKAYMKGGMLHDIVLLSMNRPALQSSGEVEKRHSSVQ